MNFAQGFIIVAGILLQTALASAIGRYHHWFVYLLILATLWGLVVSLVRGKHRKLGPWLLSAFFLSPIFTLIVLLFVPALNIHEPHGVPR